MTMTTMTKMTTETAIQIYNQRQCFRFSISDLDSVRNSCDVLYHIWMVDRSHDCDDLLQIKSSRLSCSSWASIFNRTSSFSCGAFIFPLILCVLQCCLIIQKYGLPPSCIPDLQRCNSLRLTSEQIVFCYSIEKQFIYVVYDQSSYDVSITRANEEMRI